jgi:cysteine desulfurase/selenocysteine lyase
VDALVCVDAVQSLGVLPLSVARTPIDFVVAGGHKWLCGPPGTGLFYCRRDRLELLRHAPTGWFGYEGAQELLKGSGHFSYDLPLRPAARRFEGGMPNLLGLVGLAHALEELMTVGIVAVSSRVASPTSQLREGLAECGYRVISPNTREAWSGIVGFVHPAHDSEQLCESLAAAGCYIAHPDGTLRASPHFWTADDEIAALLGAL